MRTLIRNLSLAAVSILSLCDIVAAFVPGLLGGEYKKGERIELKVNGLTSVKSQIPYSYYHLPYCHPDDLHRHVETLGELLMGETVENSNYVIEMENSTTCQHLCTKELTDKDRSLFKSAIDDEYTAEWLLDGLPSVYPHPLPDDASISNWYSLGFPVGWKEPIEGSSDSKYFVNNYISIIIRYQANEKKFFSSQSDKKFKVVGFEVVPISYISVPVEGEYCQGLQAQNSSSVFSAAEKAFLVRHYLPFEKLLDISTASSISFLYDVKFEKSSIDYQQRWDTYLSSQRTGIAAASMEVHWFSIVNSLAVVFVLSGIVAMILIRTLHKDIARYNQLVIDADEDAEESGWKLVHGDVFRKPLHSTILAALAGSGIQILSMVFVTLIIAAIGVGIHPSTGFGRGRLLQFALLLWSLMGILGGYTAARFYKLFQSPNWKLTTIRTALIYPGVLFSIFLIVNCFMYFSGSSAAAPFGTVFLLMLIWLGISTPLIFVGAYFGFKQPAIALPVRVNKIPRQVPAQPWAVHPLLTYIAGGALPFGAVFTELMFVFSSIWQHRTYMLFGLLLVVALILVITCAEIAITMVYFQLVCEDYYWWWRSFFVPGSSGVFVFLYAIVYGTLRLSLSHVSSVVLYLGYSAIIAYTFTILTGTIGFIASFLFVRAIYGSIRVD